MSARASCTFAELVDRWAELVGAAIAACVEPAAFDCRGLLHIRPATVDAAADIEDFDSFRAQVRATLPERIDGVRVRQVLWIRRVSTRPSRRARGASV